MGIESPTHIIFLAAVALIVLGPRRLPNLAKAVGRSVREFREALGESSQGIVSGGAQDLGFEPREPSVEAPAIHREEPFSAYAVDSAPPVSQVEAVEESDWPSDHGE